MGCGQDRARHEVDAGDAPPPAPDAIPVRTPGRHQAVLDGQLVVLHAPTGRFVVVAGLAALVCVATDGRATIAELTGRIAGDLGLDESDLIDEVRATVAALCHEHVLVVDMAPIEGSARPPSTTAPRGSAALRLHGTLAQRGRHSVWLCAGTDPVSTDLLVALRAEGWTCHVGELDDSAAEPVAIVLVERSGAPAGEPILGGAFNHIDALVAVLPTVTDASWHDPQALQDLADRCITTPVLPLRHATPAERAQALQALPDAR